MTKPYLPSDSIFSKMSRKMTPFFACRTLKFKLDRPIVSFTFDDFPRTAVKNGAKVLEAENWESYILCVSGPRGREKPSWPKFLRIRFTNS